MTDCITVIDIGKTNKKILLFDNFYNVIYRKSIRFQELVDDDGFPCDDIDAIEKWIFDKIKNIQEQGIYNIKAINFSTHGATLVYLDKEGNRCAPVYNYLKSLDKIDFDPFYKNYGGVDDFSRNTASPAYGMLNSGMQIYWLKHVKPKYWEKVATILHYPQYLSYLFTHKISADYTSIGAHTALWDFDQMDYHTWIKDQQIKLPAPEDGSKATMANFNGQEIAFGTGLHDSSSSIVPLLRRSDKKFVLLSTGTWIICMNPFSKQKLTLEQLNKNCLCFMTPNKDQVKSSMRFLGHAHELYTEALSAHFSKDLDIHTSLDTDLDLIQNSLKNTKKILLPPIVDGDFKVDIKGLSIFSSYEEAYCQLMAEISIKVADGIKLVLDDDNNIKHLYLSGGFNKNKWFVCFIELLMPNFILELSDIKNESALGAALMMDSYFN
jgi:sugar (pentulose or hexulose) kinase